MTRKSFLVRYDGAAIGNLEAIDRRVHGLIRDEIAERLTHEPAVETRNRKPLVRPVAFGATWELRCGPENRFRVFYRMAEGEVWILAIGEKVRDLLTIGGKAVTI